MTTNDDPAASPDGLASPLRIQLSSVTFSDESTLPVSPEAVVVIVGPNNAGKSVALRNIMAQVTGHPSEPPVIQSISWERHGDVAGLTRYLDQRRVLHSHPGQPEQFTVGGGQSWDRHSIVTTWEQGQHLGPMAPDFCLHADAQGRLGMTGGSGPPDMLHGAMVHPMHRIYADASLERIVSNVGQEAFDAPLTFQRWTHQVGFHVGRPVVQPGISDASPTPTREYLQELVALPRLDIQGDGFRSFMGLVIHLVAGDHSVVLIDEPEAFLHPPQARLLGSKIAKHANDAQIVVATHDSNLLRGLVDARPESATVVRLTREGEVNHASVIDSGDIKELWSDPILRYSQVLDGLFHRGVVVCEADPDCRFYSLVVDELVAEGRRSNPDLLFTHCGGNSRFRPIVRALTKVKVPVAVITDLDTLGQESLLRPLVEDLGGEWSEVAKLLAPVTAAATQRAVNPDTAFLRHELGNRLDAMTEPKPTKDELQAARDLLKQKSGWKVIRESRGVASLPPGEASRSAEALLRHLGTLGLFVVPVGDLERFIPIGGKGNAWLTKVIEDNLYRDSTRNQDARRFVSEILDWFSRTTSSVDPTGS